ncbi:hypothetical protein N1030_01590 [Desulfovibrio mangrovi]|uniref:hypothetical protein n=1 Tax=Desulfovibrio mangrovi TaxID=2976983 RepID=UPI002245D942|nr:hypothetical protein [Desulfovibrio mangrovi]UZP67687.1 hypothetical protein N1030_01590 [Desulfovibrio mangrovi]
MHDIRDLIRKGLEAHGYDGLYCAGECGCDLSELFACGHIGEGCEPGYKVLREGSDEYYITGTKPEGAPAPDVDGAGLIAAERKRQIMEEGWTAEHDDAQTDYELSQAAAYYCIADDCHDSELVFPSTWNSVHMKRGGFPFPNLKDLIKAGALCAAEIDRLQRAKAKEAA